MISLIGFELDKAVKLLADEGFKTVLVEVKSKKGIENYDSKRVVKQSLIDDKTVELCFSCVLVTAKKGQNG